MTARCRRPLPIILLTRAGCTGPQLPSGGAASHTGYTGWAGLLRCYIEDALSLTSQQGGLVVSCSQILYVILLYWAGLTQLYKRQKPELDKNIKPIVLMLIGHFLTQLVSFSDWAWLSLVVWTGMRSRAGREGRPGPPISVPPGK